MTFKVIGDSFKASLNKVEDYHHVILSGERIWVFSQKYVDQKTFNWGHRVTIAGGYAIAFNIKQNKWESKKEFGPLVEEENSSEVLFDLNGSVHLLVTRAFGEVSFNKLFKWSGERWEETTLKGPQAVAGSEKNTHVSPIVAEGTSSTERYIVVTMDSIIRLYRLTSQDGTTTVDHVVDVPDEINRLRGKATSAVKTGDRVIVSYGVTGCGFRWESQRFIVYDEKSKECTHLDVPGDYQDVPKFGFAGATGHGLSPNGDWIHAGGSVQVGMCDSKFDGSAWALTNLSGVPVWKKLPNELSDELKGTVVVDKKNGLLYAVGDKVAVAKI